MIRIQTTLILLLAAGTAIFLAKLRSTLAGRLVVLLLVLAALLLIVHPSLSTALAHVLGVGRGVDLVIYLTLLGQGFVILLLWSSLRTLGQRLTVIARELALATAEDGHVGQVGNPMPHAFRSSEAPSGVLVPKGRQRIAHGVSRGWAWPHIKPRNGATEPSSRCRCGPISKSMWHWVGNLRAGWIPAHSAVGNRHAPKGEKLA